jgi:hypothetical protein
MRPLFYIGNLLPLLRAPIEPLSAAAMESPVGAAASQPIGGNGRLSPVPLVRDVSGTYCAVGGRSAFEGYPRAAVQPQDAYNGGGMSRSGISRSLATSWRVAIVASLAGVMLYLPLLAPAALAQQRGDGFLFGEPRGTVAFQLGVSNANASSDVFTDATSLLTLQKSDFAAITLAFEYAHAVTERLDVFGGISYSSSSEESEFRDWIDSEGLPIEQTTRLTRFPLTAGARFYLAERGSAVGQYAWIPAVAAPHVSLATGIVWYGYSQVGDFIDFADDEIISGRVSSSGWAPLLQGGAGVDFSLSPRILLAVDGKYTLARASMTDDFEGYDNIDLSGFTATLGLKIRF